MCIRDSYYYAHHRLPHNCRVVSVADRECCWLICYVPGCSVNCNPCRNFPLTILLQVITSRVNLFPSSILIPFAINSSFTPSTHLHLGLPLLLLPTTSDLKTFLVNLLSFILST